MEHLTFTFPKFLHQLDFGYNQPIQKSWIKCQRTLGKLKELWRSTLVAYLLVFQPNRNFYKTQGDGFSVKPEQVVIGLKVAAYACAQWDRAEVISNVNPASGTVKLFFMDYGTNGNLPLKLCRFLVEHFAIMSRKAIRGALYGISPRGNSRLWDLNITHDFITSIRNKIHKIKIVIHHEHVRPKHWIELKVCCST